ncbi:MAG: GNAT family N-acetyltransferase [Planctomycetaceae bacterium]|nr:GNAT family N-acetyltransferase [Planctomycetaceae bacterium]
MSNPEFALDVHLASPEEQDAAYRNVHEFWGRGQPLEEYLRWRHASPKHRRASWYVGCVGGEVVTSLGCWPVVFFRGGQFVAGFQIGAVHTRPEFRGQGLAPILIRAVEQLRSGQGDELALLYSDIAPAYYARLGYLVCPAMEATLTLSETAAASFSVRSVDPEAEASLLREMAARAAEQQALTIRCEETRWQQLLDQSPEDEFLLVQAVQGETGDLIAGWLRVRETDEPGAVRLMDWAVTPADALPKVLAAAMSQRGWNGISGWLPGQLTGSCLLTAGLAGQPVPRQRQITMIHPLREGDQLTPEEIAAAGRFVEIDHV